MGGCKDLDPVDEKVYRPEDKKTFVDNETTELHRPNDIWAELRDAHGRRYAGTGLAAVEQTLVASNQGALSGRLHWELPWPAV